MWTVNFPKTFIKNPFGYGLGTSTLAAWKFGSRLMTTGNFFFDIVLSTGIAGSVFFIVVLFYVFTYSISPIIWLLWGFVTVEGKNKVMLKGSKKKF